MPAMASRAPSGTSWRARLGAEDRASLAASTSLHPSLIAPRAWPQLAHALHEGVGRLVEEAKEILLTVAFLPAVEGGRHCGKKRRADYLHAQIVDARSSLARK